MFLKRVNGKRTLYSIAGAAILAVLVFGSSVYAQKSLNIAEANKFAIPFPAGKIAKPTTLAKPSGGTVFIKPINVDVSQRGLPKKILNPGVEKIAISSLTNLDTRPRRVGVELTNTDFPVECEVSANIPWDPRTKTFGEVIVPGRSVPDLSFSWFLYFPADVRSQGIWYEGTIVVFDADTGESLTTVPVKIHAGVQP